MELKCLECGNPVAQTPGRRKKEYCGSTCRSLHWKKKQEAGKPKRRPGRPTKETKYNPPTGPEIKKKVSPTAIESSKTTPNNNNYLNERLKLKLGLKKEKKGVDDTV
jgi:hypothetical protein